MSTLTATQTTEPFHQTLFVTTNKQINESTDALSGATLMLRRTHGEIILNNVDIAVAINIQKQTVLETDKARFAAIFKSAHEAIDQAPKIIQSAKEALAKLKIELQKETVAKETIFLDPVRQTTYHQVFLSDLEKIIATGTTNQTLAAELGKTVKKVTGLHNSIINAITETQPLIRALFASMQHNVSHLETTLAGLEEAYTTATKMVEVATPAFHQFCDHVAKGETRHAISYAQMGVSLISSFLPTIGATSSSTDSETQPVTNPVAIALSQNPSGPVADKTEEDLQAEEFLRSPLSHDAGRIDRDETSPADLSGHSSDLDTEIDVLTQGDGQTQ